MEFSELVKCHCWLIIPSFSFLVRIFKSKPLDKWTHENPYLSSIQLVLSTHACLLNCGCVKKLWEEQGVGGTGVWDSYGAGHGL